MRRVSPPAWFLLLVVSLLLLLTAELLVSRVAAQGLCETWETCTRESQPWLLLLGLIAALALACLVPFVSRCCFSGWYPIPSYAMRRDALGMAARAHAVTIIDQCKVTAAPRYYIWSAQPAGEGGGRQHNRRLANFLCTDA
jgi:hypothetical protein